MSGKKPILPTSQSGDILEDSRVAMVAPPAAAGGENTSSEEQEEEYGKPKKLESTDELIYLEGEVLLVPCCHDYLTKFQSFAVRFAMPILVKALEYQLLVNMNRESDLLKFADTVYGLEKEKPDPSCPRDGGQNVYVLAAQYFWTLSLLAAIYGAAICVSDVM